MMRQTLAWLSKSVKFRRKGGDMSAEFPGYLIAVIVIALTVIMVKYAPHILLWLRGLSQ